MREHKFEPSDSPRGHRKAYEKMDPRGHHFGRHRGMHRKQPDDEQDAFEQLASENSPFGGGFRGRNSGHFGGRGSHFGNGGGGRRRGRFVGQGDIRLLALNLIEQEPRHGYDIIKEIEALTNGFYAPSPGVIYPTLTYLEEADYCAVQSEGNKKSYAITHNGIAYLDENRDDIKRILESLKALGERANEENKKQDRKSNDLPLSVETALLNLRETAAQKLKEDPTASSRIVQKLLAIAEDL